MIALLALGMAACGFKLRGQVSDLPFERVYITAPAGLTIGSDLERVISAHTRARVVREVEKSELVIQIIHAVREKRILSISESGRVRRVRVDLSCCNPVAGSERYRTGLAAGNQTDPDSSFPGCAGTGQSRGGGNAVQGHAKRCCATDPAPDFSNRIRVKPILHAT